MKNKIFKLKTLRFGTDAILQTEETFDTEEEMLSYLAQLKKDIKVDVVFKTSRLRYTVEDIFMKLIQGNPLEEPEVLMAQAEKAFKVLNGD